MEWNSLCNFDKGHYGKHSCEIIWTSGSDVVKKNRFFSSTTGGHFVGQGGTICAILVHGIIGKIQAELFLI